jgi:hypothetical protein
VSERSRRSGGLAALALAMACTACGTAASEPSVRQQATPSPTPRGGDHQFVVPGLSLAVSVTLPAGWEAGDQVVSRRTSEDGTLMSISAWAVSGVYADPCDWSGSIQEVGPTARELADALASQATRHANQTTVSLGEHVAARVLMSVPDDVDFESCDDGEFRSWADAVSGDNARSHDGPGQVDEVYVIDVGGVRVVMDAAYFPDASSAELGELHRILKSVQFTAAG